MHTHPICTLVSHPVTMTRNAQTLCKAIGLRLCIQCRLECIECICTMLSDGHQHLIYFPHGVIDNARCVQIEGELRRCYRPVCGEE